MMLSVLIANYIPTIQGLPWDNVRNACKLLYWKEKNFFGVEVVEQLRDRQARYFKEAR